MAKIRSIQKICLFGGLVLLSAVSYAQLTVNGSMTPTQLVQNVLLGTGITASNITYSGDITARGSFNGSSSNIGFSSGVILASGDIVNAVGPNNVGGASSSFNTSSTDPQLTAIATSSINDAAILEFDFVPVSDTIKFRYVFGSEEYMEYANSTYNDVFGFFISGPIPSGGTYSNQNIALVPGTSTPVSINNVNLNFNGMYYFDNGDGNGTGTASDGATVQYDGFTHPLTAKAAVVCGQTYHIKIAISDVGDGALDSGVFLEAGSFSSNTVSIIPHISYGGNNDSLLYEGCGQACLTFLRTSNLTHLDTINLSISGTAQNGIDYNTGIPGDSLVTKLIFGVGVDSISYCVNAVLDGTTEGLETIVLSIIQTGMCVQSTTDVTIYLNEAPPLTLTTCNDTTINCVVAPVVLSTLVHGGLPPYVYSWSNIPGSVPAQTVTPATTTTYTVTVSDACNGTVDPTPSLTETIQVIVNIPAPINVDAGADVFTCPDLNVNLNAATLGGQLPITYSWTSVGPNTVISPNQSNTDVMATGTTTYMINVIDNCGNTQSDSVKVSVEASCVLNIPNVISPDGQGNFANDYFNIEHIDLFPRTFLQIFDRWGNRIYENADYKNEWRGGGQADGTYYYILTLNDGKVIPGFFQIVRLK